MATSKLWFISDVSLESTHTYSKNINYKPLVRLTPAPEGGTFAAKA